MRGPSELKGKCVETDRGNEPDEELGQLEVDAGHFADEIARIAHVVLVPPHVAALPGRLAVTCGHANTYARCQLQQSSMEWPTTIITLIITRVAIRTLHVQREHGKPVIVELMRKAPVSAGVFAKPVEDKHRGAVFRRARDKKKRLFKKRKNRNVIIIHKYVEIKRNKSEK